MAELMEHYASQRNGRERKVLRQRAISDLTNKRNREREAFLGGAIWMTEFDGSTVLLEMRRCTIKIKMFADNF